jgi:glycine betaine/proline transport system ATP-binding protein
LLRLVNRLIEPSAGALHVLGEDVMSLSEAELVALRREKMAMVFQTFALMPYLDVLRNVTFGLHIMGVPLKERRERALEALRLVGLEGNAKSSPRELSGGMQQRVGLARALCVKPELLLMDEAFSALDPLIRDEMQGQLLELQRDDPRTILFVSHDLDEAMRIGDRIAIMDGGEIVQVGTPDEIVRSPANDFVRSFVASVDTSQMLRAIDLARPARDVDASAKESIAADATLGDVAERVLHSEGPVAVRGEGGEVLGYVTKETIVQHVAGEG